MLDPSRLSVTVTDPGLVTDGKIPEAVGTLTFWRMVPSGAALFR